MAGTWMALRSSFCPVSGFEGRGYYLAPAYPLLFAGGAVWLEKILSRWRPRSRRLAYVAMGLALLIGIAAMAATVLPIAPIHSRWWNYAVTINGDLAEEIGWPELVETIAAVRDKVPQAERQHLAILAGNYGEAGAVNLYGLQFHLPSAISGTNSFWWRGYGDSPPETVIVVGFDREFVDYYFRSSEFVVHVSNREGITNEETTRHPEILLCPQSRRYRGLTLEKLPALRLNSGDLAVLQMLTGGSFDHADAKRDRPTGCAALLTPYPGKGLCRLRR